MKPLETAFTSLPLDSSATVSWIHIGDTHLTEAGEQNDIDLGRIVDEINEVYAKGGVDFVFVPGDIADRGDVAGYEVFRRHLDRLQLPWCAIVGDHDVHEKSFENFRRYVCHELYGAFSIGGYRFLRLNAFSEPRPDSFIVDDEQLAWLETELKACEASNCRAVILLHCYPSDLKQGGDRLSALLRDYPVLLVDMGHTHYNEISNDETVLYTATRSTGQIEEGPVGYSVITLDENSVSWNFVPLGKPSLVAITAPVDRRLVTTRTIGECNDSPLTVRAKIWSTSEIEETVVSLGGRQMEVHHEGGRVWTADIAVADIPMGPNDISVIARCEDGRAIESHNLFQKHLRPERTIAPVDQDNAIGEWKERGLLGTQLGPNKNGRKW